MKLRRDVPIIIWALIAAVCLPQLVFAADGQIKLTQLAGSAIVISSPGSYVLTSDITWETPNVDAIVIAANDVTLDLNGHVVKGPGKNVGNGGRGIDQVCPSCSLVNVSILNGTVRDFRDTGVLLGDGNKAKDLFVYGNGGYGIDAGKNTTVINCTATSNGANGIKASDGSSIINCTATSNGLAGIAVTRSTVNNCTANGNYTHGISASDVCSITNCTASNNNSSGMTLGYGIYAINGASISNCLAQHNTSGIYVERGSVTNCTVYSDGQGIVASKSTVTNCTVSVTLFQIGSGILADHSIISGCCVFDCYTGIASNGGCRLEGNQARHNVYGISLGSGGNYAIKNVASDNSNGNFFASGGDYMPLSGDNANVGF